MDLEEEITKFPSTYFHLIQNKRCAICYKSHIIGK